MMPSMGQSRGTALASPRRTMTLATTWAVLLLLALAPLAAAQGGNDYAERDAGVHSTAIVRRRLETNDVMFV